VKGVDLYARNAAVHLPAPDDETVARPQNPEFLVLSNRIQRERLRIEALQEFVLLQLVLQSIHVLLSVILLDRVDRDGGIRMVDEDLDREGARSDLGLRESTSARGDALSLRQLVLRSGTQVDVDLVIVQRSSELVVDRRSAERQDVAQEEVEAVRSVPAHRVHVVIERALLL